MSAKNVMLRELFELLVDLGRALPPGAARPLGAGIGLAAWAALTAHRRIATRQILDRHDEVLGLPGAHQSEKRRRASAATRRVFANLGRWAGELASYSARPDRILERVDLPPRSREALDRAASRGRGVIWLAAHMGNWELMAWAIARAGYPLSAVGRRSYDPGITDLVDSLRRSAGVETMYRDDPDLPSRMLRALGSGRIVGMLVDQSTSLPSIDSPFLGRPAPTAVAPIRIALRHSGAVVHGFCHEDGRGRLVVEVEPIDFPQGCGVDEAVAAVNDAVGRAIRSFPDHWVWMHDRWKPR